MVLCRGFTFELRLLILRNMHRGLVQLYFSALETLSLSLKLTDSNYQHSVGGLLCTGIQCPLSFLTPCMLATVFLSQWFLRPCIEILHRMFKFRGWWLIYLCVFCVCNIEIKKMGHDNKLVNKCKHVLSGSCHVCIISYKVMY